MFALGVVALSGVSGITGIDPVSAQSAAPEIATVNPAEMLYQLTGNHTEMSEWGIDLPHSTEGYPAAVYGTDIGAMYYHKNKIYFLFGDTFGADAPSGGGRTNWRHNVIAQSSDLSPGTDIVLGNWCVTNQSDGLGCIPLRSSTDTTAIPTSGWSDGTNQYAWVMHVGNWKQPATTFYGGIWRSTDDNWYSPAPQRIGNFPAGSYFVLGTMMDAGDSYLYVYGTKAYRQGGVHLARIAKSKLSGTNIQTKFEYFCGYVNGAPTWNCTDQASYVVVGGNVGELSVIKNPHNGKYMMLYLDMDNGGISFRASDTPWGNWTDSTLVADGWDPMFYSLYGSYMVPQYVFRNSGTDLRDPLIFL